LGKNVVTWFNKWIPTISHTNGKNYQNSTHPHGISFSYQPMRFFLSYLNEYLAKGLVKQFVLGADVLSDDILVTTQSLKGEG